jgi:hypothetical protein
MPVLSHIAFMISIREGETLMPDQYGVVTRLLGVMGLAHKWHVVEPVPGDLLDRVWIQNTTEKLDGHLRLSPAASDGLSDDEIMELIRLAIAKATGERYGRHP